MYTLTEIRRDVSTHQLEHLPTNLLNSSNMSTSAQNCGGGDTILASNSGSTVVRYSGQQNINNNVYIPCTNVQNYTQLERNDIVRQLWRQQRPENNLNYQTLFPTSQYGSVNNFEQSQRFYPNYTNNNILLEQNQRNYPPLETHNILQQQCLNQTSFMNCSLASTATLPPCFISPISQINNCQSTLAQNSQQALVFPSNTNYTPVPPPPPQPPPTMPLVFGPPPRGRRPNMNNTEDKNSLEFSNIAFNSNSINNSPSIPVQTFFQSFSNRMKTTTEKEKVKNLSNKTQATTTAVLNHFNSTSNERNNYQNFFPTFSQLGSLDVKEHNVEELFNSARSNIKFEFSKNVVNIPKIIEKETMSEQTNNYKSLIDTSKVEISDNPCKRTIDSNTTTIQDSKLDSTNFENILNCQIQDNDSKNFNVDDLENSLPFLFKEENAFIDMVIEGCLIGEEIATKYQNVPCFKNIKKLCEKTKNDLMTPHCTARNIHSQGIPWATKDYIFAFTRLTSCWYLLKGYLGEKSDIFEKIEQLYSPDLRKSFELWERTTIALAFHMMKSFIALGNNSSYKWNPKAHSTPVYNDYHRKKFTSGPSPKISNSHINSNSSDYYPKKNDIQILSKNTTLPTESTSKQNIANGDFKNYEKFYRNYPENYNNKNYQNPIFKPTLHLSPHPDFDSGDESATKRYIKPGCYNVPLCNNSAPINSSPRQTSNNKKLSQLTPIILLTHKNEANISTQLQNNGPNQSFPQEQKNRPEYTIHKKDPQEIEVKENVQKDQTLKCSLPDKTQISDQMNLTNDIKQSQQIKENSNDSRMKSTKFFNLNKSYRKLDTLRRRSEMSTYSTANTSDPGAYQTRHATNFQKSQQNFYKHVKQNEYDCPPSKFRNYYHHNKNVKYDNWYSENHAGLSRLAVQTFERILNELWNMPSSHYFVFEVDVRDVPDYYDIVEHPMFLANILQKLKDYKYNNMDQVVHDFRKIFRNARLFLEIHPDNKLQKLITQFSNAFEQLLGDNFPKMDFSSITGEPNEIQSCLYSDRSGESSPNSRKLSSRSSTPSKSDMTQSSQEDR